MMLAFFVFCFREKIYGIDGKNYYGLMNPEMLEVVLISRMTGHEWFFLAELPHLHRDVL